jgi:hypothetical protein
VCFIHRICHSLGELSTDEGLQKGIPVYLSIFIFSLVFQVALAWDAVRNYHSCVFHCPNSIFIFRYTIKTQYKLSLLYYSIFAALDTQSFSSNRSQKHSHSCSQMNGKLFKICKRSLSPALSFLVFAN